RVPLQAGLRDLARPEGTEVGIARLGERRGEENDVDVVDLHSVRTRTAVHVKSCEDERALARVATRIDVDPLQGPRVTLPVQGVALVVLAGALQVVHGDQAVEVVHGRDVPSGAG